MTVFLSTLNQMGFLFALIIAGYLLVKLKAMFPEIFMEYMIFVMPFWILIYIWGVPSLLVPSGGQERTIIAKIDLVKTFKNLSVYIVSVTRLIFIPLLSIAIIYFIPMSKELAMCTVCSLAMPLGLNTVVIPSAYGCDTSVASGMALISHLLSCITIPVVFLLLEFVI